MERRTTDGAGIAARTTRRQLNGKRQYRERAGSVLATQFESGWMDEQNTMDTGVILIWSDLIFWFFFPLLQSGKTFPGLIFEWEERFSPSTGPLECLEEQRYVVEWDPNLPVGTVYVDLIDLTNEFDGVLGMCRSILVSVTSRTSRTSRNRSWGCTLAMISLISMDCTSQWRVSCHPLAHAKRTFFEKPTDSREKGKDRNSGNNYEASVEVEAGHNAHGNPASNRILVRIMQIMLCECESE